MSGGTAGPWIVRPYSDTGGYDCMFGAIRVGPVTLDGQDYGQKSCAPITAESLARMEADAALIAAALPMREALRSAIDALAFVATNVPDDHARQGVPYMLGHCEVNRRVANRALESSKPALAAAEGRAP